MRHRLLLLLLTLIYLLALPASALASYSDQIGADRPSAWWRFEEQGGQTAFASAGQWDGSYEGHVQFGAPGASADGSGLRLNEGSDVSFPESAAPMLSGRQAFTIELFVSFDQIGSNPQFVYDKGPGLVLLADDQGLFFCRNMIYGGCYVSAPLPSLGEYHQIIATYDGKRDALYIDGQLVSAAADTDFASSWEGWPLELAPVGGDRFAGLVDEFALYDYPLNAGQVSAHYQMRQNQKAGELFTRRFPPASELTQNPQTTASPIAGGQKLQRQKTSKASKRLRRLARQLCTPKAKPSRRERRLCRALNQALR